MRRAAVLSPPAFEADFPDPFVLAVAGGYVAYATNGDGANVRVRWSADLLTWSVAGSEPEPGAAWDPGAGRGGNPGDAFPLLPAWVGPGRTWSPVVLAEGAGYVLWYAAHDTRTGRQGISVAVATSPFGPFRDGGTRPVILQEDDGGSIDPSPFVDVAAGGAAYLVWKADSNAVGRKSVLWGQALDAEGTALAGSAVPLLRCDRGWEGPLIEAPCLVRRPGRGYLLFYSAGAWNSEGYSIGYAEADHPLGPWTKVTTRRPWAASDRVASGPGGQEVFTAHDGRLVMSYHAWAPGAVRYRHGGVRTLRLGRLDVTGDEPLLAPLADDGGDAA